MNSLHGVVHQILLKSKIQIIMAGNLFIGSHVLDESLWMTCIL